jgi:dethiobiotin synthetase
MRFFITGTDTGVGKTWFTCLFLRALSGSGRKVAGFKPICCGDRGDAEALAGAGNATGLDLDDINPVWLRSPAAPLAASLIEGRPVDLEVIRAAWGRLASRCDSVLVEGAGGWEVPIRRDYFVSDLAAELRLPVILVVDNKLGALNHTLLTLAAIRRRGLDCAALVLNHASEAGDPAGLSNRRLLEQIGGMPPVFEIRHGETRLDPDTAARLLHVHQ